MGLKSCLVIVLLSITAPLGATPKDCATLFASWKGSDFNLDGVTGKFLSVTNPFVENPKGSDFRVVMLDSVPDQPQKNAKIEWARDARALNVVREMLHQGVPVVLGDLRAMPQVQVQAAVIPKISYPAAREILAARHDQTHRDILFIQPTSTVDTISHEGQHWLDYEDGTIDRFLTELSELQKNAKLSDSDGRAIEAAVEEMRGHARQELVLLEDPRTKDQVQTVFDLISPYVERLLPILNRLEKRSPKQYRQLMELMAKYELPTQGKIRFTYLLGNRYQALGLQK